MANASIDMINIRQILRLHNDGVSKREIEKLLGITRKTISKYISLLESAGLSYEELKDRSDSELFKLFLEKEKPSSDRLQKLQMMLPSMEKELKRTGVTKFLLWEEYKSEYPGGYNYTQFCHYFREYLKPNEATMHFEHKAGDKMFIDFTGKKLSVTDKKTGEITEVEVFVAILGASQMTYVEAVESQQKDDFITATENALHYFEGSPRAIVPDNLKSGVTKSCKYEPILNEDFNNFLLHYGSCALPARSRKPKDKSLAENAVRIIYSRIFAKLRNKTFFSLADLNEAIWELLEMHNKTNFRGRDYSRYDLFKEIEEKQLNKLPEERYEIKSYKTLKVNKNCHIYLSEDKHYYSVPFRFISKHVRVIYSKRNVEIYHNHKRIAYHIRDRRNYIYSTIKEHMPSHHRFVSEWNPQKFIKWAANIGEETEYYIKRILDSKQHPEQGYKSCIGILTFAKKISKQRLNNACKRAIYYNSYSYIAIKNILAKGYDKLKLDNPEQFTLPMHKNVRGSSYYN